MRSDASRSWRTISGTVACLALVPAFAFSAAQEPVALETILTRMIATGEQFETLRAKVRRDEIDGILGTHAASSGELFFSADGADSRIRMNLTEPARQELLVADSKVQLMNFSTLQLQEYTLGEDRRDLAEYLVVGFGPANGDLRDNFEITLEGEEEVDGKTVSELLLIPRSEEVLRQVRSIRLWVEHDRWVPLRQRMTAEGGNALVVDYDDIRINESIPSGTFRLELPPNVQR